MLALLELGPLVHYIGQNGSICLRSKLTGSQRNINFGKTIVFWTIFALHVRKRSYIFGNALYVGKYTKTLYTEIMYAGKPNHIHALLADCIAI